jgi:hypothetical protein
MPPYQSSVLNGYLTILAGKYGINVGPMVISWSFRFINGKVEEMIGRAMADALNRQKRREKEEMKRIRREERAKEKEARRVAREHAKLAEKERRTAHWNDDDNDDDNQSLDDGGSDGENSYSGMTASNVIQHDLAPFDAYDNNFNHEREASAGGGSYSMEDLD